MLRSISNVWLDFVIFRIHIFRDNFVAKNSNSSLAKIAAMVFFQYFTKNVINLLFQSSLMHLLLDNSSNCY